MPFLIDTLLDEVQKIAQDEIGFNFDVVTELIPQVNNGVVEIVWRDPFASVYNQPFVTVPNPLQMVPADAVSNINVKYNLGGAGALGQAIRQIEREHMDLIRPLWPTEQMGTAGVPSVPIHFISDDRDPRRFWLWPYPVSGWQVQLEYCQVPDDIALGQNFPLPIMYWPACKSYVISHAFARLDQAMLDEKQAAARKMLIDYYTADFEKIMALTVPAIDEVVPMNTPGRAKRRPQRPQP